LPESRRRGFVHFPAVPTAAEIDFGPGVEILLLRMRMAAFECAEFHVVARTEPLCLLILRLEICSVLLRLGSAGAE